MTSKMILKARRTDLEPSQSLQGALVGVDTTNTTLTTGVVVEEPKGLVGDIGGDRYRENGDRSSVNGVAETGVEPVDAAVRLVCSDTWRGERGLGHRVVALGDCGVMNDEYNIGRGGVRQTYS